MTELQALREKSLKSSWLFSTFSKPIWRIRDSSVLTSDKIPACHSHQGGMMSVVVQIKLHRLDLSALSPTTAEQGQQWVQPLLYITSWTFQIPNQPNSPSHAGQRRADYGDIQLLESMVGPFPYWLSLQDCLSEFWYHLLTVNSLFYMSVLLSWHRPHLDKGSQTLYMLYKQLWGPLLPKAFYDSMLRCSLHLDLVTRYWEWTECITGVRWSDFGAGHHIQISPE